jgi:cell division protein FtsW (lipid II flippase)
MRTQLIVAAAALLPLGALAVTARWPPLPGGLALAALGALVGYSLWVGLSIGWSRILDFAARDADRFGMYCAAFALALAVMRDSRMRRIAPEVLLAGIVLVCLYSLAGRLLPHIVHQQSNYERLNEPLTYWNALGIFSGFGTLIGVALAGAQARPRRWRALACAAAVPCSLAAFLTLSRGVAASVLAGLVVCVAIRWGRSTLLAAGCVLAPLAVLAAVLLAGFPDVLSLHGDTSAQASQGAAFLPIAVVATAAAGLAYSRLSRTGAGRGRFPRAPRLRAGVAVAAVPIVLGVAIAVAGHGKEKTGVPSNATRFIRAETNRGHYWRVALDAFSHHPLDGVGTGSFAAEWSMHRGRDQPAVDAHSVYVETLAELGIVGALLLAALVGTVAAGAARAARAAPRDGTVLAAAAVLAAFAVHMGLDWDWEMPAVALIPLILAAAALQPRMDS